ncbi:hypothetical protein V6N12_009226 [Hibiscus sabdariffa]|uniref:DUF4283 domain-containing protein n=1 Tax=Hibiscus sabdariffa TaxID=183260 RepID=A0ABR2BIG7_9ROSI
MEDNQCCGLFEEYVARFDSVFVVANQSVSKVGATTAHSSMCVYGVSVASNNGSSQNCMDLEEGMAIDMGGSATGMAKASYVAALSRSSCVNPRNLMVLGDEVEIALQTGDVVADHSDSFPVIKFSGRLHNIMDRNMRQAIVVRLLRRSISYRGLWNKIQAWWKPSGRVQLVDLDNDYFLVKFFYSEDYN